MKICALLHVSFELPAQIAIWAHKRGHTMQTVALYDDMPIPDTHQYDMLLIMGGPMSLHDQDLYPWLIAEKNAIKAAIAGKKQVLGICLGAQLIADALGARITNLPSPEIGWFPITLSDTAASYPILRQIHPQTMMFHWHAQQYDLPKNAVALFSSNACANQGFLYEHHVLALQCRPEVTQHMLNTMIAHGAHELVESRNVQSASHIKENAHHIPKTTAFLYQLLDNWLQLQST